MTEDKITLSMLKSIKNKMEIEKLVFPSLKDEKLTDDFIEKFIDTMTKAYEFNIDVLTKSIERIEKKIGEKDGK